MFGKVSIKIKLVEGDSAGTVTAFYVNFFISHAFSFISLYIFTHFYRIFLQD